ncbi:MAG TPA: hypothetical protein VFW40_00555 [Capsulimonadaceae bacterium]|nr:hypothetical protein [Capsulimonadaceae bacterium]
MQQLENAEQAEIAQKRDKVEEKSICAGMPFCAGLGGVNAWLAADTDEASTQIAGWFATFEHNPDTTPSSGVFVRLDDGPQPHLTLIHEGEVIDPFRMFEGPEWKRFEMIDNANRRLLIDTTLGREPALEVRKDELIVMRRDHWPLYLHLAHGWLLMQSRRLVGLHTAVAAVNGRALLLVGASGAGKSTLSLALMEKGADCFGDEWAFFRLSDHSLWPWPRPLHLRPGGIDALGYTPEISEWYETRPGDPKAAIALPEPSRPCPHDKAVFVFLDGFADTPAFSEIGGAEAARRLLQGILFADPGAFERLSVAADLVSAYPCTVLKSGTPAETARQLIAFAGALP